MNEPTTEYYFEAHITIDPVMENNKILDLKELVKPLGFRLAKLFMQKGVPSNLDSFLTAKAKDYPTIVQNTIGAVSILEQEGYIVRRYKIENILLDIKL